MSSRVGEVWESWDGDVDEPDSILLVVGDDLDGTLAVYDLLQEVLDDDFPSSALEAYSYGGPGAGGFGMRRIA